MHYKAEKSITADGLSVIDYIPTFLLLDYDSYGVEEVADFIAIMSNEIVKGNSFDAVFIKDCRVFLELWVSPQFGLPDDKVTLCNELLSMLKDLEPQNILNTHKSKGFCMDMPTTQIKLEKQILDSMRSTFHNKFDALSEKDSDMQKSKSALLALLNKVIPETQKDVYSIDDMICEIEYSASTLGYFIGLNEGAKMVTFLSMPTMPEQILKAYGELIE